MEKIDFAPWNDASSILNDGQNQKILSNVPEYEIKVYDLASQEETVDEKLESIRKEMAYQILILLSGRYLM